ncbi:MAG: glycosyltransferase [Candidatus Pacebacteria bacterium]|nr:glycosyltransferase [Candidatus Paceibacterota bacterium]
MKILIITQKVDENDGTLGFFSDWIREISKKFEKTEVISLRRGVGDFPGIKMFSLGKEGGLKFLRRIKYAFNFYRIILKERKNYDAVFVHMNQEYVLLGGFLWKIMGKKVFLWRNHPRGNFLTMMAVFLSDKVFYTSSFSYTAKFRKAVRMPVGVKIENENPEIHKTGEILKILYLGRVAPIKHIEIAIEAAKILKDKGVKFKFDIIGKVLEKDREYEKGLRMRVKNLGLLREVNFFPEVSHKEAIKIFSEYDVLINVTDTGSMDKTIFEAGVAGVIVISSNKELVNIYPYEWKKSFKVEATSEGVAEGIVNFINLSEEKRGVIRENVRNYIKREQSLKVLVKKMKEVFSG